MLVVYQQVYRVRHLVWSCHSEDAAAFHKSYPAATQPDIRDGQSADEDKEPQEKREEDGDDIDGKRDRREHWNDGGFSDG